MKPFIFPHQFNFIKSEAQKLINGHSTVNDQSVLGALKSLGSERVLGIFEELTAERREVLGDFNIIEDHAMAERFLNQLKEYVIPFPTISEQTLKKLFPKVKKIKMPLIKDVDTFELTYMSWDDNGSGKRYIVFYDNGKYSGVVGVFTPSRQKGICSICNKLNDVGMFVVEKKGDVAGTFIKRGNSICIDSMACNRNIASLDRISSFIQAIK